MLKYVLFLLVALNGANCLLGSMKNVTVTGELNCGRQYYGNIKVELWEADTFDRDDKMNATTTNDKGKFNIYGQRREIRNIEPYLLVHHNCKSSGVHDVRCQYIDRFDVPKSYQGSLYGLGPVNLADATKKRKVKSKC